MTRVAVVDYGMGNRRSVHKALEHAGASVTVSADPGALGDADGLVVPGVGAFPAGMQALRQRGLDEVILAAARHGTPVLGICLGMQLLFDGSQEREPTAGLGLLAGEVTPLRAGGLRLPHIGWNHVSFHAPSPLIAGLPAGGAPFYHVHSLAVRPHDSDAVIATTTYGERFATIVSHGPVHGVQFHPEKSSADGLTMLRNFIAMCAGGAAQSGPARAAVRA